MNESQVVSASRQWVEEVVVGYNLCPFAKRELVKNRVRFVVSEAENEDELLQALQSELQRLEDEPDVETTLLIHPGVLQDFFAYNEFLDAADALLSYLELEGVFQVASFHPDYQFAGTDAEAAENYTNRSPYPMLHLLREASLEAAIDHYPDVDGIPDRNIALMNELGVQKMRTILKRCTDAET
ncbi:MAG: DUF1415 domain-containing protein [Marinobacter nauticus]|jgi:Uncharacterized protein conserved in bacteria|uniref:DUF1415 domain-containing protein n=1 Tax=Marinobacter TaxID=2742 RepID=UPI0003B81BB6|nr:MULTISPECIES: DUF1415 domain-containing protein [Marinobacter]ERS89839.1 lipoprotein signal peptidase [Marinobacter sp. C1S70]RKR77765.1 hypothetical protein C7436_1471 [Marinobacter nauticus]